MSRIDGIIAGYLTEAVGVDVDRNLNKSSKVMSFAKQLKKIEDAT